MKRPSETHGRSKLEPSASSLGRASIDRASIELTDVTLRDGLQMAGSQIATEAKHSIFRSLLPLNFARIEITSFVHPKWVPQFADADALCSLIAAEADNALNAKLMAFVPNVKGLERLEKYPIGWVSAFVATTESFNRKNVNVGVSETISEMKAVAERCRGTKRKFRLYLSTVWGCPYEGEVSDSRLEEVIALCASVAPDELALSDTIGVATPTRVAKAIEIASKYFAVDALAVHMHDTYGLALANIETAVAHGIRKIDGSIGGIGGCPYAKGASGNVALDEIVYRIGRDRSDGAFSWKKLFLAFDALEDAGLELHSKIYEVRKRGGSLFGVGE